MFTDLIIPELDLIPNEDNNELHAKWTDLGEHCRYSVAFSDEFPVETTNSNEKIFCDIKLCKEYKVEVKAITSFNQQGEAKEESSQISKYFSNPTIFED